MRDAKRIYPFCMKLISLWLKHPDLRFFQLTSLIADALGHTDWAYNAEEAEIEKALDKLLEE